MKNAALIIVSFAMLMESVDSTILNTAIPTMANGFNVHPVDMKLALISYLLSLAIFIPISGWVADKFGIKKVFIAAITLFTLSSFFCGLSQSLGQLILARIIQGIGGSFTMPVGRLVILKTYERHELIAKMSVVIIIASIGMMLGPLLGGLIVNYVSWRWIFWVNVPIGITAACLSWKILAPMPKIEVPPLDKLSFILFGGGLSILTFGLSTLSESYFSIKQALGAIALSMMLLTLYVWHAKRTKHPIINIQLFSIRTFQISVIGNLLTRLSFGGLPFLLPLLLQLILGYSPKNSGLLITPIALGVLSVKPIAITILRLLGYRKLLIINIVLISCSIFSFSFIDQNTSVYAICFLTFLYGFFIALQYTGMNSLAFAEIKDKDVSTVNSIMSTIQQLALSFGVALAAILLGLYKVSVTTDHGLTLNTFQYTFKTLSLLTFLAGLVFLRVRKDDGSALIGSSLTTIAK